MSDVVNKTVSIYIDQTAANTALVKLQATADSLNKTIDAGRAAGKNMTAELAKLSTVNAQIQSVQNQLDNGLAPSLKQQQNLVAQLRAELNKMSSNADGFADKVKQYQQQNATLKDMQSSISGVKSQNDLLNTSWERIGEFIAEYASLGAILEKGKELISESVEESNNYADAILQFSNALENVGRNDLFGEFADSIEKFTQKYQTLSKTDVTGVFTKLIDVGKLTKTQITELTDVIINYAAKEKISLADATDSLTRYLSSGRGLQTFGIGAKDASTFTERLALVTGQLADKLKGTEEQAEQTARGGFQELKTGLSEYLGTIGDVITGNGKLEQNAFDLAVANKNEADSSQKLVDQYIAISQKTNQTAADKQQLQNITSQLAATFGISVVEINKETGALELNVEATKDLIKQKLLLADPEAVKLAGQYNAALENYNSSAATASKSLAVFNNALLTSKINLQELLHYTQDDFLSSSATHNTTIVDLGRQATATETEVLKLRDGFLNSQEDVKVYAAQITDLTDKLSKLGFSANDINKLITPQKPDAIVGNGDPNADEKSKYDELQKLAEDFNKKIRDLQEESTTSGESQDQKQIDDAKHKYDEIILEYNKLKEKLAGNGIKLQFDLSDIQKLEKNEIASLVAKQIQDALKQGEEVFKQAVEDEYNEAQQNVDLYYDNLKTTANENYAKGKIDYKAYQAALTQIDADRFAAHQLTANQYVATDKKAADDVVQYDNQAAQKDADNAIAEYKKKEEAILKIDEANIENAKTVADKKAALKKEYDDEIANELLTDADKEKLHADYLAAIKKLDDDAAKETQKSIINMLDYAKQGLDILDKFSQAQTNKEQAQLQVQLASYTAQQNANQKLLNAKLISANEFASRSATLTQQEDSLKEQYAKKEFARQQKIQIAQTLINGAAGIVKLWTDPGFPAAIPMAIALAATTAAQIALIASQKASFAIGGKVEKLGSGKINSSSNIPMQSNGDDVLATVKRGEVILNEAQQAAIGGPETFKKIGVPGFANGGYIPKYVSTPSTRINYDVVSRSINIMKFADGGLITQAAGNNVSDNSGVVDALAKSNDMLFQSQKINSGLLSTVNELNRQLSKGIATNFSLSNLQQAQDMRDRILQNATFK